MTASGKTTKKTVKGDTPGQMGRHTRASGKGIRSKVTASISGLMGPHTRASSLMGCRKDRVFTHGRQGLSTKDSGRKTDSTAKVR